MGAILYKQHESQILTMILIFGGIFGAAIWGFAFLIVIVYRWYQGKYRNDIMEDDDEEVDDLSQEGTMVILTENEGHDLESSLMSPDPKEADNQPLL